MSKIYRKLFGVALVAAFLVLPACSGGGEADKPPGSAAASESPSPEPAELDAEAVAEALGEAGMPVTVTVVYTEENDPNELMGRPGGYTSKVAFADERIDRGEAVDSAEGSVELGGGVEVFADAADAKARAKYIADVTAGNAALTEYTYVEGSTMLRLSRHLTPAQARKYRSALAEIV